MAWISTWIFVGVGFLAIHGTGRTQAAGKRPAGNPVSPFAAPVMVQGGRIITGPAIPADLDLDGRMDLVVGNVMPFDAGRGPASFYRLSRGFRFVDREDLPRVMKGPFVTYPVVATADMNGDSLPEVIAVNNLGTLVVLEHKGSTAATTSKARFVATHQPHHIAGRILTLGLGLVFQPRSLDARDFNHDGNNDILICGDYSSPLGYQSSSGLRLLAGDGRGGLAREVTLGNGRFIAVATADINGDGVHDIVALRSNGELLIIVHEKRIGFSQRSFSLPGPLHPNALSLADVDKDGRIDFLIGGGSFENAKSPAALDLYLGSHSSLPGKRISLPLQQSGGTVVDAVTAHDLNGDDAVDLAVLVSPKTGAASVTMFAGDGQGGFTSIHVAGLPGEIAKTAALPGTPYLKAVDLNGDRNDELLVSPLWYRGAGEPELVHVVLPNTTGSRAAVALVGQATAGSQDIIPKISAARSAACLGSNDFGIRLADVPGDHTPVALWWGSKPFAADLLGIHVNVFPVFSWITVTAGRGIGGGHAVIGLPVPELPGLLGRKYYFQWVISDRGSKNPYGLSASQALVVEIVKAM